MLSSLMAGVTSWIVASFALFGTWRSDVMYFLGLVLVIARLCQEIPKAIKAIKEWAAK